MKRECCEICGKELKIRAAKVYNDSVTPGREPSIVTELVCEDHGLRGTSGTLFEEAKLYYEVLE